MAIYPTPVNGIVSKYPQLAFLNQEDLLNLELSPISDESGIIESKECDTYLRISGGTLDLLADQVPFRELDSLFDEATGINANNTRYLTGLKITFGVANVLSQQVFGIYTPVKLETIDASGAKEKTYRIIESGNNYRVINNQFDLIAPPGDAVTFKDNYWQAAAIMRHGTTNHINLVSGEDTTSVLFPFQTLFTLDYENNISQRVDNLLVYNSIRKENITGGGLSIKHCLLLSPEIPVALYFNGKFANRSHLCPPDCLDFTYRLA